MKTLCVIFVLIALTYASLDEGYETDGYKKLATKVKRAGSQFEGANGFQFLWYWGTCTHQNEYNAKTKGLINKLHFSKTPGNLFDNLAVYWKHYSDKQWAKSPADNNQHHYWFKNYTDPDGSIHQREPLNNSSQCARNCGVSYYQLFPDLYCSGIDVESPDWSFTNLPEYATYHMLIHYVPYNESQWKDNTRQITYTPMPVNPPITPAPTPIPPTPPTPFPTPFPTPIPTPVPTPVPTPPTPFPTPFPTPVPTPIVYPQTKPPTNMSVVSPKDHHSTAYLQARPLFDPNYETANELEDLIIHHLPVNAIQAIQLAFARAPGYSTKSNLVLWFLDLKGEDHRYRCREVDKGVTGVSTNKIYSWWRLKVWIDKEDNTAPLKLGQECIYLAPEKGKTSCTWSKCVEWATNIVHDDSSSACSTNYGVSGGCAWKSGGDARKNGNRFPPPVAKMYLSLWRVMPQIVFNAAWPVSPAKIPTETPNGNDTMAPNQGNGQPGLPTNIGQQVEQSLQSSLDDLTNKTRTVDIVIAVFVAIITLFCLLILIALLRK